MPRLITIDKSVIDQINAGNVGVANFLQRLSKLRMSAECFSQLNEAEQRLATDLGVDHPNSDSYYLTNLRQRGHSRYGDDSLTIQKGNRSIEISLGGQSTHALASIDTVSDVKVGHAVISDSVTSQTLNMFGITLKAPLIVEIDAPFVIIKGNMWVTGGIGVGPTCRPV